MSKFKLLSRFNPEANFKSVRIGSDSPVLEVELNELQDIAEHRYKSIVNTYIGDGITGTGTYSYADGVLHIINEGAIVKGNIIEITSLQVPLEEGESAYLKVWEDTVDYTSSIKLKGNSQEKRTIENTLLDPRVGEETSRRIQVMYDLVKEKPTGDYLLIGTVEQGSFVVKAELKQHQGSTYTYNFKAKDGQQVCSVPRPYKMYSNALIVFVDGKIQVPKQDYEEVSSTSFRFLKPLQEGADVTVIVTTAPRVIATTPNTENGQHGITHTAEGSDPLDIADLLDRNDLLPRITQFLESTVLDGGSFNDDLNNPNVVVDGGYF